MTIRTIAFLYPGAMGASLAQTLHHRQPNLKLLTDVSTRSKTTISRSEEAGLIDTPLAQIIHQADLIISILPPSEALTMADTITTHLSSRQLPPPIYLDANAISPGTITQLANILRPYDVPFIDGCVIGLPATKNHDPKIYLSSDSKWQKQLEEVAKVLSGGEDGKGLKIRVMENAGEGAASALKMCYGGINKGSLGLASLLVLAANAHSPATAQALLGEFADSQSASLKRFGGGIPDMIPKAYRFVGEMQEISSFISTSLNDANGRKVAETYQGLADVFQRIADDLKSRNDGSEKEISSGSTKGGKEVDALSDWAEKASRAVQ